MANDEKEPKFYPDVPTSTALVPRTADEAAKMMQLIRGELPPNRQHFYCFSCGQDRTLEFGDDEMVALGNDLSNYKGPCWNCGAMTVGLYDRLKDDTFRSIDALAQENKRKDYEEQADVFLDKAGEKVAEILGVGAPKAPKPVAAPAAGPPNRANLPDADDIDISQLKPRG